MQIKRLVIVFVILLTLSTSVYSYKVRFMYPYSEEDKEYFINQINSIEQIPYFTCIGEIRIYNPEKTLFNYGGLFIPRVRYGFSHDIGIGYPINVELNIIRINVDKGDFKHTLIHELAHNYLWMGEHELSYCNLNHLDCFKEAENEIEND